MGESCAVEAAHRSAVTSPARGCHGLEEDLFCADAPRRKRNVNSEGVLGTEGVRGKEKAT